MVDFVIEDDRVIGINNINKCGFSGTELLERIELLALLTKIKTIYLDDQSPIKFGEYRLDFAVLQILTKGESWYNSLGYYQENYNDEKNEWDLIRNIALEDIFDLAIKLDYATYKTKNKGWFDDGLLVYSIIEGETLTEDNYAMLLENFIIYLSSIFGNELQGETVKSFAIKLSILTKNYQYQSNPEHINEILDHFLMLSLISYCITYTRFPLYKRLS